MQIASVLAGLAISQTRTALAHGISYPVTSHLGVPHGLACSFTLPQLLSWCLPAMVNDGIDKSVLLKTLKILKDLKLKERIYKAGDSCFYTSFRGINGHKGAQREFQI